MAKLKQSKTVIIKRSQINFAPYNPRKESKEVIDELKRNFRKVGYLGGIVWNKLTGNLVGGHKRIEAMDLIFDYPANDYDVKVEEVEFDDKTEKEQNIFLNNKRVQGETDYEMLAIILPDIDIENTGLTDYDIQMVESIVPDFHMGDNTSIIADSQDLKKNNEEKKTHVKELKKTLHKNNQDNQTPSYFTVTFKDYNSKAEFLEQLGINGDDVFIVSKNFLEKLNEFYQE
jgi:hypothetical protein